MLTQSQTRRIVEALSETNRTLDREMRYSPEHRDTKLIAFCTAHLRKLVAALETNTMPPFRTEVA